MLYYFWEEKLINKDELEKIFEENNSNKSSLFKNNILKIYSEKEENIVIDIFINQSINNLNSEWWFNLDFDKIKNNKEEYKKWKSFIETKLWIVFWKIKNEEIDEKVFEFWRDDIIWKFLKNKWYNFKNKDLKKEVFFSYYNYSSKSLFEEREKYNAFDILKEWNNIFKYQIMFELLFNNSELVFDKYKNINKKYLFKLNINFWLSEDQIEDEAIWIEWVDYPHWWWKKHNLDEQEMTINSISYSKINPLDDIKVIKEEWFKK
jgi:hypothetical protein